MAENELLAYFYEHYHSKEEVIYRLPMSVSIETFWPQELAYRQKQAVRLPLSSWDGHPYWYAKTQKLLDAGDRFVAVSRDDAVAEMVQYVHDDGIMEEAFYSSVIEGAYSTKQRAKEVIKSKLEPKDRSEQMIVNNYEALHFVLDHLEGPINHAVILEIGRILTKNTEDSTFKTGYRDGGVDVLNGQQEVIYHAPDASFVRPLMDELLAFVADPTVHPVIKACAAHIGFVTIHPFFDGNGRTARALAYMILLKAGYTFVRQFPISGILAKERAKYYKAIRASQDPVNGYDFTYFMVYYADMLARSVADIHAHVARFKRLEMLKNRMDKETDSERILRGAAWMTADDVKTVTAEKWRTKFKVSFETARRDLQKLTELEFVTMRVEGRKHFYDVKA